MSQPSKQHKKVRFEEDDSPGRFFQKGSKRSHASSDADEPLAKETRHTLESDEEIEEEGRMLESELAAIGQEPTCAEDFAGDIRITPFNMKDEMETGFFDENGCYRFDRRDKTTDAWLDNIDWTDKRQLYGMGERVLSKDTQSDDEVNTENEEIEKIQLLNELALILNPGETVLKCIKRFGGKRSMSSRERWSKVKPVTVDEDADPVMLDKVIGIANSLLSHGVNDIYEYTQDKIRTRGSQKYQWEYTFDCEQIQGPLDTEEMIDMLSNELLNNAKCRLIGAEVTDFQPVSRFDFDLYL